MNKDIFNHNKEIINKIVKIDNDLLGYEIHTNKQIINLHITNSSGCCENWGVITTEDKLEDFVGSEILSIESIDYDYKAHPLLDEDFSVYDGGTVFVDINTSKGKLQFVIYNEHNGYYGHYVNINSTQLTFETVV